MSFAPLRQVAHHEIVDLLPGLGPWVSELTIRRVAEDDGSVTVGSQLFDIAWRVFDVEVGADSRLICEKAEVPIRNVVTVEPFDRLLHGNLVEVLDK